MKTAISYTLAKCSKCMKCLRICPTNAISITNGRVQINQELCINCGQCIKVCQSLGLQAKGSTLSDVLQYDYSIALVPSVIYANCKSAQQISEVSDAILACGFNEVYEMSQIESSVVNELNKRIEKQSFNPKISSFCPVVNRLIQVKYPMLVDKIIDLDYPHVIAARLLRKKYEHLNNVGIFYFSECVGKLVIAKYPYGDSMCEIDHALSIGDIFPTINRNRKSTDYPSCLSKQGIESTCMKFEVDHGKTIAHIDSMSKVQEVLELCEFSQLNSYDYLSCSYCSNGCVGGNLLWGNAYESQKNVFTQIEYGNQQLADLSAINLTRHSMGMRPSILSMGERIKMFKQVNDVLETLPQFDCGACGFASCRQMAEQIVLNQKERCDCRILNEDEGSK